MKVLILGSDGYIGHALSLAFLQAGKEVVGVDNLTRHRIAAQINCLSVLPHYPEALPNTFDSFRFYELDLTNRTKVKSLLEKETPSLIIDCSRLYSLAWSLRSPSFTTQSLTSSYGFLNLIYALNDLDFRKIPVIVLTDLNTYPPSTLPISEGGLKIHSSVLQDILSFPTLIKAPGQLTEVLVQTSLPYFRNHFKLPLIDLRVGLVYGVYPDEPFHRLHVDFLQGNFVNYYCAQGVRQGIVNVATEGKFPLISLRELVSFLVSFSLQKKIPPYSLVHAFTSFVSMEDLIYKIKHLFAEDFGYRLRIGFYKKLTHLRGWPEEGSLLKDRLHSILQSVTISLDEELVSLIDTCFSYKKQISSLPKV